MAKSKKKITELLIHGERYVHTSTLAGGGSLYRVWKHRNKISEADFEDVSGGLYIKASVAGEIVKNGMPRKSRKKNNTLTSAGQEEFTT